MPGAGFYALAACTALFSVHLGCAVYDVYGVIGAGLDTAPHTKTPVSAFQRPASDLGSGKAIFYAFILKFLFGIDAAAAVDMSYQPVGIAGRYSHDLSYGLC